MSSAGSFQDKTLNKVALCSAVFAGFAYVGYSYARTAFCRRLVIRPDDDDRNQTMSRVVLRRLSQTTQTDALLGNLDFSGSKGKLILRPKSVQERIKELNLRAQQFTDAFIAIQSGNGTPSLTMSRSHAMHGTSSMQCSPFHTPRLLSPIDIKHLIPSRSTENLTYIPDTSPVRPNWKRKSFRKKKIDKKLCDLDEKNRLEKEAVSLYENSHDELHQRLNDLSTRGGLLSPFEAKSLVALLYSKDTRLIERSLVTIANCAAFSVNLDFLRESGCIHRLCELLQDKNIRIPAIQTLGNVILSEDNINQAQDCLPLLLEFVESTNAEDEALRLASLVVLTNLATTSVWHEEFCPVLHRLYQLVDSSSSHVQLQSLRLLVNLSCNGDMIPSLLAAEGPPSLSSLVSMDTPNAVLLRVLLFIGTLATAVKKDELSHVDLPIEDKAASPDTMFTRIYGVGNRDKLLNQAITISRNHEDPEIRRHAKKLANAIEV